MTTVPTWRSSILAFTLACAGCVGEATPEPTPSVSEPGFIILAATGDTDFFQIDVDLAIAFCSTTVGCPPTVGAEAIPSLLTGATCGLDTAWDGAVAYARKLTCYTGGDPDLPGTWTGATVITDPASSMQERAYSAVVGGNDTQYVNSTLNLEPLAGYAHCLYEAEALIALSAADDAPRAVYHRENPARMTWRVVVEPGAPGVFDCHFGGSPVLSSVDVDYPLSVTFDRPTPMTKGTFPATYDYATVEAMTLKGGEGAARIRYVLDADVPVAPRGVPSWAERGLFVEDGASILDAVIDSTCARVDGSGQLQSVGVLFRKASDNSLFGAVEALAGSTSPRFECDRVRGACRVIPHTTGNGGQAACLGVIQLCHDGLFTTGEADIDCGGACAPCPAEDSCSLDADCLSGRCDVGVCVASPSCSALNKVRPSAPSGRYELDPDKVGGASPFVAYCDMTPEDAGWTLLMRLSTNTENMDYASSYWDTSALLNETAPTPAVSLLNATDAKYPAFNSVVGRVFRLDWLAPEVTWTETRPASVTALTLFSGAEIVLAGNALPTGPRTCHGDLLSASGNYSAEHMQFGEASQFYGFNGSEPDPATTRARWGFGSTDGSLVWQPQAAIGVSAGSLVWAPETACKACGCNGASSVAYPETAANLWVR